MITFIQGDLLEITEGVICHQVNCRRVAGAGIALQIRNKWPDWYQAFRATSPRLGKISLYEAIEGTLYIANLFSQTTYGTGKRHTNCAAFGSCLMELRGAASGMKVYFPKCVGCGLAGGNWQFIYRIIEDAFPNAFIVTYSPASTKLFASAG